MSIENNHKQFKQWWSKAKNTLKCDEYDAFEIWQASANREGCKLVPVNDINIADMIWGKCPCGSSRSPIVSDREGYNLIHCFACGANKYIHEDY